MPLLPEDLVDRSYEPVGEKPFDFRMDWPAENGRP